LRILAESVRIHRLMTADAFAKTVAEQALDDGFVGEAVQEKHVMLELYF